MESTMYVLYFFIAMIAIVAVLWVSRKRKLAKAERAKKEAERQEEIDKLVTRQIEIGDEIYACLLKLVAQRPKYYLGGEPMEVYQSWEHGVYHVGLCTFMGGRRLDLRVNRASVDEYDNRGYHWRTYDPIENVLPWLTCELELRMMQLGKPA